MNWPISKASGGSCIEAWTWWKIAKPGTLQNIPPKVSHYSHFQLSVDNQKGCNSCKSALAGRWVSLISELTNIKNWRWVLHWSVNPVKKLQNPAHGKIFPQRYHIIHIFNLMLIAKIFNWLFLLQLLGFVCMKIEIANCLALFQEIGVNHRWKFVLLNYLVAGMKFLRQKDINSKTLNH